MLSELVFTIICVQACIAVYLYFMWRVEVSDSLYWRSRAEYYQKKLEEITNIPFAENYDDDPANWWKHGKKNPYEDAT